MDGLVGQAPKLVTLESKEAGNRSIHTTSPLREAEIKFLEYRMQVVQAWPESERKRATLAAILSQLERYSS